MLEKKFLIGLIILSVPCSALGLVEPSTEICVSIIEKKDNKEIPVVGLRLYLKDNAQTILGSSFTDSSGSACFPIGENRLGTMLRVTFEDRRYTLPPENSRKFTPLKGGKVLTLEVFREITEYPYYEIDLFALVLTDSGDIPAREYEYHVLDDLGNELIDWRSVNVDDSWFRDSLEKKVVKDFNITFEFRKEGYKKELVSLQPSMVKGDKITVGVKFSIAEIIEKVKELAPGRVIGLSWDYKTKEGIDNVEFAYLIGDSLRLNKAFSDRDGKLDIFLPLADYKGKLFSYTVRKEGYNVLSTRDPFQLQEGINVIHAVLEKKPPSSWRKRLFWGGIGLTATSIILAKTFNNNVKNNYKDYLGLGIV